MLSTPVIAVFDIGKTNKKLLLFNEQYQLVHDETVQIPEIADEDGFPCEDLAELVQWIESAYANINAGKDYDIKAINFSGYGASLVYIDGNSRVIAPLYNYLKPFPGSLQRDFYDKYGGEAEFSRQTASPVLGSLNSGMQLLRIQKERPELFHSMRFALHLPQFLSWLFSGNPVSDITSIGCHTNMWQFGRNDYHQWVTEEGILPKLAPIVRSSAIVGADKSGVAIGAGLHDSSSALIPYLMTFEEPFILLSTGTWSISLDPFNLQPLTALELEQDCLSYLSFEGSPVKAARLFAGQKHENEVRRLSEHFHVSLEHYKKIHWDPALAVTNAHGTTRTSFAGTALSAYKSYEAAYHSLLNEIVWEQRRSTGLLMTGKPIRRMFVDGGFSNNAVYMNLLAASFPQIEIYAASIPQASALGAALAIHEHWNSLPRPADTIHLRRYSLSPNARRQG